MRLLAISALGSLGASCLPAELPERAIIQSLLFPLCSVWHPALMADRSTDDELIFDLGYALKRAGLRLPIESCRQIAARVLAHLKLARWEIARRPADEMHGSYKPEKPVESGPAEPPVVEK